MDIDSTSILVAIQCLVPISCGRYNDSIWCDVIPMTLTHILLGCTWLYDQDVYRCEKNNTYQFMFNNETIVLKPMSSGKMKRKQEVKPKVAETRKTSRVLLKLQNKELYSHKRKLKSWNRMLISQKNLLKR